MLKHLLTSLLPAVILSSCVSAFQNRQSPGTIPAFAARFQEVDTTLFGQPDMPPGLSPVSLLELPRTEDGAFVLAPGWYETDFKTYCLQPGTPGPSSRDVYFQAPLEGERKDLIQTILLNSRMKPHLEQKNVQLLLWAVVSHSDFDKLSPEGQFTARQLLSPKQLFQLQGGVLGMVKTMARLIPASGGQSDIRKLFDLGTRSYEAFEQLAVINTPAPVLRPDIKQDQWHRQKEGYYVRYLPASYKQTRIQVYVPHEAMDSVGQESGKYLVFDPTSWVVVPANSKAQQLGIGGPLLDIVKSVIRKTQSSTGSQRPKEPGKTRDPVILQ